eukprot:GHUV01030275.1.p2 GENE.GHUV01030275.1~~GHUV01030275.1.p2  ORF type:complete len:142 (+),score=7.87 GHUV01030275.1:309-734(+)
MKLLAARATRSKGPTELRREVARSSSSARATCAEQHAHVNVYCQATCARQRLPKTCLTSEPVADVIPSSSQTFPPSRAGSTFCPFSDAIIELCQPCWAYLLHHDSVITLKCDIHVHISLHGSNLVSSQEPHATAAFPEMQQ